MEHFAVESDPDRSAFETTVKGRRLKVLWKGRYVTALSQGARRAYLYPLFTPRGQQVTAEAPIDHPHHQSVSVGIDTFSVHRTDADGTWTGRYNFYMDEAYQGMAPGRIISRSTETTEIDENHLRITQTLDWSGPTDWANPSGPTLAAETRTIDVRPGKTASILDITSRLRPAEGRLELGPAFHGYFLVRMADGLRPADGAVLLDSEGRSGCDAIRRQRAGWVDCSGVAAHGKKAGMAVFPYPPADQDPWHLSDWGYVMVNPFRLQAVHVGPGEESRAAVRVVAHDGDLEEARIPELYDEFREGLEAGR